MSAYNIQFHDKIRKFPEIFVFLSCRKNFVRTQKQVNKPSVFKSSRFYCMSVHNLRLTL